LIRHPVLPNLREQLVLPLKAGNDLIGAIDLQSETLHKFSEDDIPALSVLADQLAIAIQKNQLTSNMEQTLNELETAYGRYTRESWESFLAEKNITGYRFSQLSVEPTTSTDPEVREAWMTGEIVVLNDGQSGRMLVPMKVRGQVIGVLNLGYQGENLTQETRALVDEIATRLGLIMENARLVETAQRRVERERLVGEVTTRMRQTLDMDSVLRTSVEEIARTLGLPEMEIRLGNYMSKLGSNGNGHQIANGNILTEDGFNDETSNGHDPLLDDDVDDSPPGNPQGLSE
jgi:GAF domain-containing protein